ncbi:MAG: hypothetical protein ABSH46_00580 [Bryobacteraceae bacterium]
MNTGTGSRYSVQRQRAESEEWRPVSACNSMVYARIVANAGLRRRIGVRYRLIDNRSGATTVLLPELGQKAA